MTQTTDTVLMIRPAAFGSNPETAASNAFQDACATPAAAAALDEFDSVVAALRAAGVTVLVVEDTPDPPRPDAVFPNNWLTTHEDGTAVVYPMMAPSRRAEVRPDVIDALRDRFGFRVERVLDLTAHAEHDRFMEGTGSLVLDRVNRVAFACRSPRTDAAVLGEFCDALGYEPFLFDAVDADGVPIYHTNVMMWIGPGIAGACLEAVADPDEHAALRDALVAGGRDLVKLTLEQMAAFAGNALALRAADGGEVVAMSARAWHALDAAQRRAIEAAARVVTADIATIETCGGGSVRCMLAEIFLPR